MAAEQLLGVAELLRSGLIDRGEFDALKESILLQPPPSPPPPPAAAAVGPAPATRAAATRRLGSLDKQLRGGDAPAAPVGGAADEPQRNLERAKSDQDGFKRMYESTRTANIGVPMSAEQLYRFDTEGG